MAKERAQHFALAGYPSRQSQEHAKPATCSLTKLKSRIDRVEAAELDLTRQNPRALDVDPFSDAQRHMEQMNAAVGELKAAWFSKQVQIFLSLL